MLLFQMESSAGHLMSNRNNGKATSGPENTDPPLCENISCRASLPWDSTFCKDCSCHLCGQYDEDRDRSLWISCELDGPQDDCCEMSCHINCAIQLGHLGVSSNGPFLPLDVSYWCTFCGKVSDIIELCKHQLTLAKGAEQMGDQYHRFSLCLKLMENTVRYAPLRSLLHVAVKSLVQDVGTLSQLTKRLKQIPVSKRTSGHLTKTLCTAAIEMACMLKGEPDTRGRVGGVPPACRILVEDVSETSFVIYLNDCPATLWDGIISFDIWCWQYQEEDIPEAPTKSFESSKTKATIRDLRPSTEYAIRVVSSKTTGPFGVTEAKCFTQGASIIYKRPDPPVILGSENEIPWLSSAGTSGGSGSSSRRGDPAVSSQLLELISGLPRSTRRDASIRYRHPEDETPRPRRKSLLTRPSSAGTSGGCGSSRSRDAPITPELLTELVSGLAESSKRDASIRSLHLNGETPRHRRKSRPTRLRSAGTSGGSGSSTRRDAPPITSGHVTELVSGQLESTRRDAAIPEDTGRTEGFTGATDMELDCGPLPSGLQALGVPHSSAVSDMMDLNVHPLPDLNDDLAPPSEPSQAEGVVGHGGSATEIAPPVQAPDPARVNNVAYEDPVQAPNPARVNNVTYEDCVSKIRQLENKKHVTKEFRLKFLTWLSFRANELQKSVCYSFVESLSMDNKALAEQLIDTFSPSIFNE